MEGVFFRLKQIVAEYFPEEELIFELTGAYRREEDVLPQIDIILTSEKDITGLLERIVRKAEE